MIISIKIKNIEFEIHFDLQDDCYFTAQQLTLMF